MKIKQKGVHDSLVARLRKPLNTTIASDRVALILAAGDKLDAIGEALAYIIEKKHTKRKIKLSTHKTALKRLRVLEQSSPKPISDKEALQRYRKNKLSK